MSSLFINYLFLFFTHLPILKILSSVKCDKNFPHIMCMSKLWVLCHSVVLNTYKVKTINTLTFFFYISASNILFENLSSCENLWKVAYDVMATKSTQAAEITFCT